MPPAIPERVTMKPPISNRVAAGQALGKTLYAERDDVIVLALSLRR